MKKKVVIIGQFPPPMHGLSKALDTLVNSKIKDEFNLEIIDIKDNKKFFLNLMKILKSNGNLYYLTISQSKLGNLRDLIMMKLIQYKRKELIIHLHGGGFREVLENDCGNLQRKVNYKILRHVNKAIVLGESLKKIFDGIIEKEKIFVVKNCVDDDYILSEESFEKKINEFVVKENIKILYLSNFILEKGYFEVLKLAKECKEKKQKNIQFYFAGKFFKEEDEKFFQDYIKKNKLEEYVFYKGIVLGEEKKQILKECDYFILPTRYRNEGQPISIIEAMINGLYVITTNHAGILDIVNEEEALILDKNNIEKEVKLDNIQPIIGNKKELGRILCENRKKILKEFNEKNYIEEIRSIFNN